MSAPPDDPDAPALSIGEISRATGIDVATLRAWERDGLGLAARGPSGHRRYPASAIPRLQRIADAVARGHPAQEVVRLPEDALERLLGLGRDPRSGDARRAAERSFDPAAAAESVRTAAHRTALDLNEARDLLAAVEALDGARLRSALEAAAVRLRPIQFLEGWVRPLMTGIGNAWRRRALAVGHEHFVSAHVADVLHEMRRALEPRDGSPRLAIAALPGDAHELGPLMAGVAAAASGWSVAYLGLDTPVERLVATARESGVEGVGVGVSVTAPAAALRVLRGLPDALPRATLLVVGGAGAPARLPRARRFLELEGFARWAGEERGRR